MQAVPTSCEPGTTTLSAAHRLWPARAAARTQGGRSPTSGRPALFHHFMFRPTSVEGLVDGATSAAGPQEFAFALDRRPAHPLYDDGAGHHHDPRSALAGLWHAVRFAAHQYFRVRALDPAVVSTAELEVTDVAAWRRRTGVPAAALTANLSMSPSTLLGGVPQVLDCRAELLTDGVASAVAEVRVIFPVPGHGRASRPFGRARQPAPGLEPRDKPRPHLVGRADTANVVIGRCVEADGGGLTAQVVPDRGHPVFDLARPDRPALPLLLEAARQLAFLHTARLLGSVPVYRTLAWWRAELPGAVDPGTPLYCTSANHRVERDGWGRPLYRSTLTFVQGERPIGRIEAAVLEDC
jgi:2-oxo-3-(phosphooxy)propyl 3-oxoalkanoate synthase